MINNQTEYRSRYDVEYVVDERTSASAQLVVTSTATQVYPGMHLCIRLKYDLPAPVLAGILPQTITVNLADGTATSAITIRTSFDTASSPPSPLPAGYRKAGDILCVTLGYLGTTSSLTWVLDDYDEMIKMTTLSGSFNSILVRSTPQSSGADPTATAADGVMSVDGIRVSSNQNVSSIWFDSMSTGTHSQRITSTSHSSLGSIISPWQGAVLSNKFLRYNGTITPTSGQLQVSAPYTSNNSNYDMNNIVTEKYYNSTTEVYTDYTRCEGDWLIDNGLNVFQFQYWGLELLPFYKGKLDLSSALSSYLSTNSYTTSSDVQTMIDTAIGNAIGGSY